MSRKPDYRIKVKRRSDEKGKGPTNSVGAAWVNEPGGSISIVLDLGVVLSWNDDLLITLFPIDRQEEPK
jgi:hypothetical protein